MPFADEKLVSDIEKRFDLVKNIKKRQERDWKLNLSFLEGRQWVVFDATSGRIKEWQSPKRKPRVTVNIMLSPFRRELARLTRNDPTFLVKTVTGNELKVRKARATKAYLDYLWRSLKIDVTMLAALHWAVACGTGFTKVYYDPQGGDLLDIDGEMVPLGAVMVDYCSPFEIYPDPFARVLDEASWLIHARVRPVEYIKAKYGVSVGGEPFEVLNFHGISPMLKKLQTAEADVPSALVKEYWERPNAEHPDGKYVVIANKKLLYEGDNPYAHIVPAEIPFACMRHLPRTDQLFGDTVMTHLRPVQVAYNKLRSDIVENTSRLANPPVVAPLNALLKEPEFNPGEIIYFNPMVPGKIDQFKVEPYPPQLINTIRTIMGERDDISSQGDVTKGNTPRGMRSSQAMAQLLAEQEVVSSLAAREYEACVEQTMRMVVALSREFVEAPVLLRVLGEDRAEEVMLFKAKDIPHDADIMVAGGSTLPKSKEMQQQYLFELWDRQIVSDPRLLLSLTEYGSMEEVFEDTELDTAQALRENVRLKAGESVPVEQWQNHAVHIQEHTRYMKTVEYEDAPEQVRAAFAQHYQLHQQLMMQLRQAQMQQEAEAVVLNRHLPRPTKGKGGKRVWQPKQAQAPTA